MNMHLSESAITAGVVTRLADASSVVWNGNPGCAYVITLTGNRFFGAPTELLIGGFYGLSVTQGAGGSHVPSWSTVFRFASGVAPTLTIAEGATDILFFYYDGVYMNLISTVLNAALAVAAPSGLTASTGEVAQITLNWVNNAVDATSIQVQRDDGAGFGTIDTVGPTVVTYVDTNPALNPSSYQLIAYRDTTPSPFSNVATGSFV